MLTEIDSDSVCRPGHNDSVKARVKTRNAVTISSSP
jgi:hypothetical protein